MKSTAPTPAQPELARLFRNVKITDFKILLACLSIGFIIRLVPELLAYPLPIGFDTIYYASVMKTGVVWAHWTTFFTTTWLLNALIVPLYSISQIDPFLLLKPVAPLLYGLNVAGIFWFARKTLNWNMHISVLAGVFFALQLASLRISWDLLANTLGLGFLLFALSYVKEVKSRRGFALLTLFSLLTVFAHEFAAVTLLVTVLGMLAGNWAKKRVGFGSKRLVFAILPALIIFSAGVGLKFSPISYVLETNIVNAGDFVTGQAGRFFFIVDYLHVQNSVDYYPSYLSLVLSVFILFAVLFLPYLFLVGKGFFRNDLLTLWTGLLLFGAFGCLAFPLSALMYWHRWMFMMAYPFTFYAVNGFGKLAKVSTVKASVPRIWLFNKKTAIMIALTFSLAIAYLATPVTMVIGQQSVPSATGTYMYFSTSPTVPYEDVDSVMQAMKWLNANLGVNSCVVLHHAFLPWGQLILPNSHKIVHFASDIDLAVNTGLTQGFAGVYFVWWNVPLGWYGVTVPSSFICVQSFGRISVYVYGGVQ